MDAPRSLVVVADDFGIGPATSRGILDLAARGKVTGTALLVNSPHAEDAVRQWRRAGGRLDLGWHACLTLDRPVLSPQRVPGLVRADGTFHPLPHFVGRLLLGRVRIEEVHDELRAQHDRFVKLVGRPPALVSGHHHIQVMPGVGRVMLDVLSHQRPLPYVRRVCETLPMLAAIRCARFKRALVGTLGRRFAELQRRRGFPGNDTLAGITDPRGLVRERRGGEENLLLRWLGQVPGRVIEFVCHPGHADPTLVGREEHLRLPPWLARRAGGLAPGAWDEARPRELALLQQTDLEATGPRLAAPSSVAGRAPRPLAA